MASTVRLGNDTRGNAVHVPLRNLLPTVHPNDIVLGGWDICGDDLAIAMSKAAVLVREGGRYPWFTGCHTSSVILFHGRKMGVLVRYTNPCGPM